MLQILSQAPPPFAGTEVHTLPNGFKIILKNDPTIPVVAMQIWTRCGAIDESPRVYGISHGLEHMVFKGTPTRSAGEIAQSVEFHGGSMNAATQLETTHYYIDIPSYSTEPALDVLMDTLLHPTFPDDELERERLVILEEIHRRDDSPDAVLWDEFASNVFYGTPYGIKVIGTKETVSSLTRQDLLDYFAKHYVPSNLTAVLVGDFKKSSVLKRLEKAFADQKNRPAPPKPRIELANGNPSRVSLRRPVQLGYIAMGIPTIGIGDPDAVALDVLADVLGGGHSARFYRKLREETETVLSISCDYITFSQKGLLAVFVETLPQQTAAAIEAVEKEFRTLKEKPVEKGELNRAKARIKSDWLYGSETPRGQASTLGSLSALGHLHLIDNYLDRVEKLTTDDIMDVYAKHVLGHSFQITTLEPGR